MTVVAGQLRRQRTLGEILGGSLRLYRRHFRTFLAISLVGLASAAFTIPTVWYGRRYVALADASFLLGFLLDFVVVGAIAQAVATAAAGLSPGFGQSYSHVLSRLRDLILAFARVFGIAFLVFIPVFLIAIWASAGGFALSGVHHTSRGVILGLFLGAAGIGAIPAAYLLVRWAFFLQAVVLEDTSSGAALSYSRDIVHGHWCRAFGILLVVWLVGAVIGSPATAISWTVSRLVGAILGSIIGTFVLPFTAIAYTLLFFDLQSRERERVSVA